MNDPVALLKQDHREVEKMLKTLAASNPGARRRATVDKLTDALALHMRIEEADIYPLVAKLVGKEDAHEGEIEHELARVGIAKVRELVDEPGFGAAVAMLTAGIKHHVKEEEHEMFPRSSASSTVNSCARWVTKWQPPSGSRGRPAGRSHAATSYSRPARRRRCPGWSSSRWPVRKRQA